MKRAFVALAVMWVVAACGDPASVGQTTATTTYTVSGYVHSGPTCPVVITPPDPTCDDRPVAGAVLIIRDASGGLAAETRSLSDGTFMFTLPAGTYTLVPQPVEGLMGTAAELDVIVVDGAVTHLDVAYDTGIR